MSVEKSSRVARIGGVVVGVAGFVGVNVATGRAIVPTIASVSPIDPAYQPSPPEPPKPPYEAVCSPCHQSQGQGIPYAFPPLAGSDWLTADPETPIRIVLLGLGGAIQVNGATFNLVMPPPVLTDEQIAEAITYARTSFGNTASAVDTELVKKVRDSLGGRSAPWTAAELTALRASASNASDTAKSVAAGTAPAPAAATAAAGTKKPRAKLATPAPARPK
jgi:mono/diheme cytochrome c family protein